MCCLNQRHLFIIHRVNAVALFLQKHEDESEGWLHRQVRTLGHLQSLIKIKTIYRQPSVSPSFLFLQNEKPLFSKDGLKLFFTRAIPQGGRGKFFHISMSISQVGQALLLIIVFMQTFIAS